MLGVIAVISSLGIAIFGRLKTSRSKGNFGSRIQGPITFTKNIAPIVFQHCASCHRPGQSAPFALLNYEEVKKHGKQIAEVTKRRIMPPWMPEPGYVEFADERLLNSDQIELIKNWVAQGAMEGNASDLPPQPKWTEGWHLGEPDLVVQMPQPFLLPAEGKDIYRNFVVPIPVASTRYVRAVEFRPGNPKVVHHAFVRFDSTRESRRLDALDAEPGFGGIHTPSSVRSPDGFFLSWQPGRIPSKPIEGLAWPLEKSTDLVLQTHLQTSGKPEALQSSVGFYFSDKPPTNAPFKIELTSFDIDIPAGEKAHVVKDKYVLPVDVEITAILPHAHFLGKKLQGYALLPDGTKKWLLLINEWNFNWQGDYRYAKPIALPKGTTLAMEYVYDNSSGNARNPNQPPKRVRYGLQSSDEMAELWLQVLLKNGKDRELLARDYQRKVTKEVIAYNQYLLRLNPKDARSETELAKAFLAERRMPEALQHLRVAAENAADYDEPHYYLGLILRTQGKRMEARAAFEHAIRINPENFKAHGNLGLIFLEQGNLIEAESHFRSALKINPNDSIARESLDELLKANPRQTNTPGRP